MDKRGSVIIRVSGLKGNLALTPENYDIREVLAMLENAESLLYTGDRKERPVISYAIEEGSVKHILTTLIQYVIGFNAILGQISQTHDIDFLDNRTAKAFENIQEMAVKKQYDFSITTSLPGAATLKINASTSFYRTESFWADTELYVYGKVVNAGGKDKANIHLSTDDYGVITIETPKTFLVNYEENLLYKPFGVRVAARQDIQSGEIDKSSLKFIELVDYRPVYDEKYLKGLRDKAQKGWLNAIDADSWLRELRG